MAVDSGNAARGGVVVVLPRNARTQFVRPAKALSVVSVGMRLLRGDLIGVH